MNRLGVRRGLLTLHRHYARTSLRLPVRIYRPWKASQYSSLALIRVDDVIPEPSFSNSADRQTDNGGTDSLHPQVTKLDLAKAANIFTRYPVLVSALGYKEEAYRIHNFRGLSQLKSLFGSSPIQIVFKPEELADVYDCHVTLTLSLKGRSLPIEVSAVGTRKALAERVAMLRLLLELDQEKLLEHALPILTRAKTVASDQKKIRIEVIPGTSICVNSIPAPAAEVVPEMLDSNQTPLSQSEEVPTDISNSLKFLAPPAASEDITKASINAATVLSNSLEQHENGSVPEDAAGSLLSTVDSEIAINVLAQPSSPSESTIQGSEHHDIQLLGAKHASTNEHAIFDAYNVAAKLSLDLEHKFETVLDTGGANRKYRVEINLHDHNLKIVATGHDPRAVESSAFVAFKKQAQMRGILDKAPVLSSSQHPVVLSTLVAINFMDFYKDHYNPKLRLAMETYHDKIYQARFLFAPDISDEPFRKMGARNLECLISLATAVRLVKKRPELWDEYIAKLEPLSHRYVAKADPVALDITQSSLILMRRAIEAAQDADLASPLRLGQGTEERIPRSMRSLPPEVVDKRSKELLRWYNERLHPGPGQTQDLPIIDYKAKVLETVENNQYSFIVGQTGSGKTTQVPQILLDHYIESGRGGNCRIICTQPRRIAATSVAKRVAKERGQEVGDQVGFHVALDKELPRSGGSILYCTTGILLNQLIFSPDALFDSITHILIDEVHERDMVIDFVLITLRKAIRKRIDAGKKAPKVSFMSATMNAEEFESYFTIKDEAGGETRFPTLHVPGRTFPIKKLYLEEIVKKLTDSYTEKQLSLLHSGESTKYLSSERKFSKYPKSSVDSSSKQDRMAASSNIASVNDEFDPTNGQLMIDPDEAQVPMDLVSLVIAHIAKTTEEGSILVFLPGLYEIHAISEALKEKRILGVDFNDESKYKIFALHSSLAEDQKNVFEPSPQGCRKIVLATNIAETSVTIPDIQHVIDTGKHREKNYDQITRVSSLPYKWISKSSSKQRAGRAGRVQNGNYYALFTTARHESLRSVPLPEILRTDLQSTCLSVKLQGHEDKIQDFLASALEPPAPQAVEASLQSLKDLGALTPEETITPLGKILGSLPLHPALGKMIVLGIIFRCLDPMIILGAAGTRKYLFRHPIDMMEQADDSKRGFTKRSNSDHLAVLKAFNALRTLLPAEESGPTRLLREFALEKFLSLTAFRAINDSAKQIEEALIEHGMILHTGSVDMPQAARQYGGSIWNQNSEDMELVKAVLLSGLYPNVARKLPRGSRYQHPASGKSTLTYHPSSMNNPKNMPWASGQEYTPELVAFSELRLTSANELTMRDTTEITAFMAAFFGGTASRDPAKPAQIVIDKWLPLRVVTQNDTNDEAAVQTVLDFHKTVRMMKEYAFNNFSLGEDPAENEIFELLVRVLKVLLNKQQDLNRYTQRYEFEFMRALKSRDAWASPLGSKKLGSTGNEGGTDLGGVMEFNGKQLRFRFNQGRDPKIFQHPFKRSKKRKRRKKSKKS
ncbi:hypothetical protein ACMFMG_007405 [Clarireedia jacksonii]